MSSSGNSKKKVVYSLNLAGGNKYVGKSNNLAKRLRDHFSGRGAQWTKKHKPLSVHHVEVCKSDSAQRKTEKRVYEKLRDFFGKSKVRGAGHTKSY